jgi:hypothetical protein
MNRLVSLAIVLAALGVATPTSAADPVLEIPYDGTQAFRGILHKSGLTPLTSVKELAEDPAHSLLIVLGDTGILDGEIRPLVPGGWQQLVRDGAAVLIATDRPFRSRSIIGDEQVAYVTGEQVAAPPGSAYHMLSACPIMDPMDSTRRTFFRGPLRKDGSRDVLKHVATNRPSWVDPRRFRLGGGLTPLAVIDDQAGPVRYVGGYTERGDGRLLILADHSVFINAMMIPRDTDNFDFAFNCIAWLAEEGPKRSRVLFVEDGRIQDKFDTPLAVPVPPLPPLDALVPPINHLLMGLQNDKSRPNFFNRILVREAEAHALWLALLTALLVGVVALYGYFWLARSRYRGEWGLPSLQKSLQPAVQQHEPAPTLLQQRHQAQLAAGNLWEAAHVLVRLELPELATQRSMVKASGSWWQRWWMQRQVERLRRLAGGRPMCVSPREFARLPGEIRAVKTALASGAVSLVPALPAG